MRSLFEDDGGLKVRSLKSLEVQFQIQPADGAAAIDLKPIFGAKTVEDVSAGEPLDGLIFVGGGVPTANPSMQMVHFCLDFPIFMFLMSLR